MTSEIKSFDDLLKKLEEFRRGIEKGAEKEVHEVGQEYYDRMKARLIRLADEHEDKEPFYVAKTLRQMADNLKLEIKKGRDGFNARLGWEAGRVEDLEHILYGNREIMPVDVFGGIEGEINMKVDYNIKNQMKMFL